MAEFPIDVVIKSDKAKSGGKQAEDSLKSVDSASQRTLKTLERLNRTLSNVDRTLNQISGTRATASGLSKVNQEAVKTERQLSKLDTEAKKSSTSLASLGKVAVGAVAGFITLNAAIGSVRQITEAALQYERLNNTLKVGTGSTSAAAKAMSFLREQANELGLNLPIVGQQFAKLSAAARGTALEGQATRDIFTGIAQASTAIGLSAEQTGGALTAIEQIISKGTVSAEELRGQLGERLPGAFQIAARSINVTTQELGEMLQAGALAAEDLLPALAKELTSTFGDQAVASAEGLNAQLNRMSTAFFDLKIAIGETGIIDFFNDAIVGATNFLNTLTGGIRPAVKALSDVEKQEQKILDIQTKLSNLKGTGSFPGFIKSQFTSNTKEINELEQQLEDAQDDLISTQQALKDTAVASVELVEKTEKLTKATDNEGEALNKAGDARAKFIGGLFDELEAIGKTSTEIKKLKAERLGANDAVISLIDEIDESTRAFEREQQILKEVESTTEQFKTSEQQLNDELARLNTLLQNGLGWQEYQAAVASAKEEILGVDETLKKVEKTSRSVFGDMSQFGIQAARNIQSAFADFLFNPFQDGLDGMLKNFIQILKRMLAELASSGILNGIASIFRGGTFGGGVANTFGGASSFSNLLPAGLGTRSGGQFSNVGGAGTAFIGGPNTALGGTGTGGASIAVSSLISAGRTVFAGLGGAAIGTGIGSAIAGDKEVFGQSGTVTSAIASGIGVGIGAFFGGPAGAAIGGAIGGTIGGVISGIFGRGPLKQKETRLLGDVSLDSGFEGVINTRFQAKGGLLRGGKTDNVLLDSETGELLNAFKGIRESGISGELREFAETAKDTALTIDTVLDTAIQQMGTDLRNTATILGISSEALDNFSTSIDLAGEKGEPISAEQINQAISDVGDHMANVLVPGLNDFRRDGENASQALSRITSEFVSLEDALIVFGVSAKDAEAAISGMGIAARTELVEAAGGFESLNEKIGFFASNFLTAEEQLDIATASLTSQLQTLGIAADITVEDFKQLIISVTQAGGASVELANSLLSLAPAFIAVRNAEADLAAEALDAASKVDGLTGSMDRLGAGADIIRARFDAVAASEARITAARKAAVDAENQLAVESARGALSAAQKELSDAQSQLGAANSILSTAKSNLSSAQQALSQAQSAAIQDVIDERQSLINSYEEEANALRGLTNRFDNLADKLISFRDSLATSDLSPFTPGQQLAITRQRFDSTLAAAQGGDADALDRLPQVADEFLRASRTFNGATDAFKFDFDRVTSATDQAISVAISERDIAQATLDGVDQTVAELKLLNEATRDNGQQLLSIEEATSLVERAQGEVAAATANVADINARIEAAQGQVAAATQGVEDATRELNGGLSAIEEATKRVGDTMFELGNAILQGFGNAAISDQQIRDFLAANPTLSVQEIVDIAIAAGVSGSQFARATGTPMEQVNFATGGRTVSPTNISDFVNANLNDPFAIIEAARANGITRERLAAESILTLGDIDAFVRDNNIAGFMEGTDRTPRAGLAFIHENESIGPSTMPAELQAMREQLAELIVVVEEQTEALVLASDRAADKVVDGNVEMAETSQFAKRSEATIR